MVRSLASRARTARSGAGRWVREPRNAYLLVAVLVGFALRLTWVLCTTRAPINALNDPAQYLRLADQLGDRHLPSFRGRPTAFWPPGWPMALAPVAWLTFKLGWPSTVMGGALLNVAAGTTTIVVVAQLAAAWGGRAARNPAAWLTAAAAGPIFYTSSLLAETWYCLAVVSAAWLATVVVRGEAARRHLIGLGLLVGYAVLVRGVGVALLAAPALASRGTRGSWRGAARPTGSVVLGAMVLLLPWTVRNGLEVGVWTPTSTNTATQLCMGNQPGGTGLYDVSPRSVERCFRRSPYDDPALYRDNDLADGVRLTSPDEAEFYTAVTGASVRWIVSHPLEQFRLVPRKTFEMFRNGSGGLDAAEDFGAQPLDIGVARSVLAAAEDAWYWAVVTLAVLALWVAPAARRAWPVWGLAVLQWSLSCLGIGLTRYQHPILPFVVVLAAIAIAAARRPPTERDVSGTPPDGGALPTP